MEREALRRILLGGAAVVAVVVLLVLIGWTPPPAGDREPDAWFALGPAMAGAAEPGLSLVAIHDPDLAPLRRADISLDAPELTCRPTFALTAGDYVVACQVLGIPFLPGEVVSLVVDADQGRYELRYAAGSVAAAAGPGPGRWRWTAPAEPGVYALRVAAPDGTGGEDWLQINAFVVHPRGRKQDGALGGYRIGHYQPRPLRGDPAYLPPRGFAEVAPDAEDILVAPRFTVGQFLCKQPGDPRYLVLSPRLYLKLEAVLAAMNDAGHRVPTFHVMSGYRTPAYNRSLGNRTSYSRHLYGDAADIFVDTDGDGLMDDLDGNGVIDHRDAKLLSGFIEAVERSCDPHHEQVVAGGIGVYRRNAVRGPYVHVDARGWQAAW
jgi:hypothetical protein